MKKFIFVSALALFLAACVVGNASAQVGTETENETTATETEVVADAEVEVSAEAGLIPGTTFYFLDVMSESIGGIFTFGDVAKAERYLKLASERLAEARELADDEDSSRAEKATKKYEERLAQALEKAKEARVNGKDTEAILEKIAEATSKHQEVLAEVLEKVPETAKEAIQNAIERSQRGHDTALEAVAKSRQENSDEADDVNDSDDNDNDDVDDSDDIDDSDGDDTDSDDDSRPRTTSDAKGALGNVTTSAAPQRKGVVASVAVEAEADVFADLTFVKVEIGDVKTSFTTNVKTRDEVITQIIQRSPALTKAQVEAVLDFEVENRASRPEDLN